MEKLFASFAVRTGFLKYDSDEYRPQWVTWHACDASDQVNTIFFISARMPNLVTSMVLLGYSNL
jgi:hypothetical protein